MDFLERITKQASELTVYDVTSALNKAKNIVLNLSEIEIKVRDCTTNDPWGASSTLMTEIAQATFNFQLFNEIMPTIYQRFTEKEAVQWRQIYKALVLLEFLVKNGSERVIDDARAHLSLIKVLRNFYFTDDAGKDQGINVRNRSKELAELLSDLDRVRLERRKAKANRNKYTGVGSDNGGSGGPSFVSNTGSRYGGFGSDSLNGSSGAGGAGSSSTARDVARNDRDRSFQDPSARSAEFEEYDAGDWEAADVRSGATGRTSSSTSHRSKPVPSTPQSAPVKVKEVNLFDFDDDEQAPMPISKSDSRSAVVEDEFDDFQSGPNTVSPAVAPAYTVPSSRPPNAFSMLSAVPISTTASPFVAPHVPAPAMQPMMASFSSLQPSRASTGSPTASIATAPAAKQTKGLDDFSDLFSFGPAPVTSSKAAASGVKSMAEMALQSRQDSLFGASSSSNTPPPSSSTGNGWDSLI